MCFSGPICPSAFRTPSTWRPPAFAAHPGPPGSSIWINDHLDIVRLVPTEIGIDQQRRLEEGRPIRAMGELTALEALDRALRADPDAEIVLLFEDVDVSKRRGILGERASLISTGDFLRELKVAGLIQSADHILDRAAAQGCNVEQQRTRR